MHVQLYRTALCIYGSRSVATAVADLTRVFFFAPVNNRERGARPFNSVTWMKVTGRHGFKSAA